MIEKAMILAAGYGTRLKPFTDSMPKPLFPFRDGTILSYQIERLKSSGVKEIVINAHHFYDKIIDYFQANDFGIKINIIVENDILGTGGGVLNAKKYLESEESFLVINVDVFTDFNVNLIDEAFTKVKALAMLAIQNRKTSRYLEFDYDLNLIKRVKTDKPENNHFAFNGIHVISSEIFKKERLTGYKDIIDLYIELTERGDTIKGFNSGSCYFIDLGKIENIKTAEESGY